MLDPVAWKALLVNPRTGYRTKGFARVAVALKELVLDTPDAQEIFERLVAGAKAKGLLPAGLSAWASFRVGGDAGRARRMDDGGASAAERDAGANREDDRESAAREPRARGGRGGGHLMRLDSAPDLIARARSLKTVALEKSLAAPPPGERAPPLANGAARGPGPGSPLKGPGSGPGSGPGAGQGSDRVGPLGCWDQRAWVLEATVLLSNILLVCILYTS